MTRFATSRYARSAAIAALQQRFSTPEPPPPACRHCEVDGPCLCGQLQRAAVLAMARTLLQAIVTGPVRIWYGDLALAIGRADWHGATSSHLATIEHRATSCAKTARVEGLTTLAAGFESLAREAHLAALALPR